MESGISDIGHRILSFALSWPGVVFLLALLVVVVIVFKDELASVVRPARKKSETVPRPRRCPNNPAHILDPNWEVCPYCEGERTAMQKSAGGENIGLSTPRKDRTEVGRKLSTGDERVTHEMRSSGGGDATRRIVGVIVTYTWRPEGQLFQIYEGRNFIGRADVSSEAIPRPCDIQILQDPKMSAEHALILCRQRSYEIIDQETTNGTFVNGEPLKANQSNDLPNYAKIRTGGTEWIFIKIDAPQGEVVSTPRIPGVISTPRPPDKEPTKVP